VYVRKTAVPSGRLPVAKVLGQYRGQSAVERRFHPWKGPLAVAPVFWNNPERSAALVCMVVWALLVLAWLARPVRRRLRGQR
jgi:transposase